MLLYLRLSPLNRANNRVGQRLCLHVRRAVNDAGETFPVGSFKAIKEGRH